MSDAPARQQQSITAADFRLISCQATLFTPDEEVSGAKIVSRLLPDWIQRFDAEPIVLPSPEGFPREFPRVILQSSSEEWRCEISSARLNIFWKRIAGRDSSLSLIFDEIVPLLHEYRDFLRARVGRIAAVVTRFAEHQSPGVYLAHHYCQDRWLQAPLNRPESFELHAHKRFEFNEELKVNSWVRNRTGFVKEEEEQLRAVLVEQDMNSLAEEESSRDFDTTAISSFFVDAAEQFDTILALYYPPAEPQ